MIQAIKDLADAFVPSGRLIELVDISLVSLIFFLSVFCGHDMFNDCSTFCDFL